MAHDPKIMIQPMIKEVCVPCSKFINIGQPILECEICFTAIHTRCHKIAKFSALDGIWCCQTCSSNQSPRYNPFPSYSKSESSDKFYDDEAAHEDAIIQSISRVLDGCSNYSVKNLNNAIDQLQADYDTPHGSTH